MATMSKNEQTARRYDRLLVEGKVDEAITTCCTPDVQYVVAGEEAPHLTEVMPWAGYVNRGQEQLKDMYNLMFETVEVVRFDDNEYITDGGDVLAVFGRFFFKVRTTEVLVESDFVARLHFRDGKIATNRFFEDRYTFGTALREGKAAAA